MAALDRLPALRDKAALVARTATAAARTRQAADGAVVLAYHDVVESEPGENEWVVSAARLRSHVVTLRRLGFEIVDLDHLLERFDAGESVDRLAVLTFDDALRGVHRFGAPVLADLDAPATVFVVSDAPEGPPAWWPNSGPIMAPSEVAELHREGWTIGAHSKSHASLPTQSPTDIADEVGGSRRDLQARGYGAVDAFAYPFGHYDQPVLEAMRAAGYRAGFSFLNGRVSLGLDRLRLPRLTMGVHSSAARLSYHLMRSPDSWPDHQLLASAAVSDG